MTKKKTNIIIIGFGNSGSSAAQDLLKEYGNIGKFSYEEPGWSTGEMNHFRLPGMIGDQLSKLTDKDVPDNLTASLIEVKRPVIPLALRIRMLIPDSVYSLYKKNEFTRSYASETMNIFRQQQAYHDALKKVSIAFLKSNNYNERFAVAEKWLYEVNEIFGKNKDFVLHKPIFHESHLDVWPKLFEPFKVLVIFREPYDQISTLFAPGMNMIFKDMNWKYKTLFGLDKGNRRLFHMLIDTIIMRMKCMDQIENAIGSDRMLKLDFEGLVKNYDVYKTIIENFIGLSPNDHVRKGKYFKPEESVTTINKYNDILDSSDYAKLAPMKEWYDQNMAKIKKKYFV
jgi:hypothetical protein